MPMLPRDADRSRNAILDAAETLFAARGYHPTSLADIGERAGVSRGTPGYFFGTKESLYVAVLERCFAEARQAVLVGRQRAADSGEDTATILAGVVADYVDYATSHPDFIRLIHREALGEGPAPTPVAAGLAVGSEVVAALAAELELSVECARQLALSLLALTWFPVLHRDTMVAGVGIDADDPDHLDRHKLHVTTLLRAALAGSATGFPQAAGGSR